MKIPELLHTALFHEVLLSTRIGQWHQCVRIQEWNFTIEFYYISFQVSNSLSRFLDPGNLCYQVLWQRLLICMSTRSYAPVTAALAYRASLRSSCNCLKPQLGFVCKIGLQCRQLFTFHSASLINRCTLIWLIAFDYSQTMDTVRNPAAALQKWKHSPCEKSRPSRLFFTDTSRVRPCW